MIVQKNQIEILIGNPFKMKGDVVLNWTTSFFERSMTASFRDLVKESGPQPIDAIYTFQANISQGSLSSGDSLSTIPGLIKFNLIIHSIIPFNNFSWLNIMKTISRYKEENLCRTVFIPLPNWEDRDYFISEFLTYQTTLEDISFIFVVTDDLQKRLIEDLLKQKGWKFKKKTLMKGIDDFFKRIVLRISALKKKQKNGHNQKKL